MNFNSLFLKSFRLLLLPIALVYGSIVIIRNFLYNKKIIKSAEFSFPLICIGNLVVGGTGKSPMVEYLIGLLKEEFRVATVSRGYKRKTRGYALAGETTTALDIGDEPMQFHLKFPDVPVAVGEERIVAIPQLLHDHPDLQAIILDDAFQHREIRAGMNILLTGYGDLFTRDFFLPTGDLRDQRASYARADILIVTKCPAGLTEEERDAIITEIQPKIHQQVFFTSIDYGTPYHIVTHERTVLLPKGEVLLVCGIANPKPLKAYLVKHTHTYYQLSYNDHHIFRIDDLKEIQKRFVSIGAEEKIIITTEKDAVRLLKFSEELRHMPVYVLPIRHQFLFDQGKIFNATVRDYIRNFNRAG